MYNLSHSYIYEYQDEKLINKSIDLLIKSSNLGFKPSIELLCLIILKMFFNKQTSEIDNNKTKLISKNENQKENFFLKKEGKEIINSNTLIDLYSNDNELINFENIKQELSKFKEIANELIMLVINNIYGKKLYIQSIFNYYYKEYEEIEFIYNLYLQPIYIKDLYDEENEQKPEDSKEECNITTNFYEGFGHDIYQKQ